MSLIHNQHLQSVQSEESLLASSLRGRKTERRRDLQGGSATHGRDTGTRRNTWATQYAVSSDRSFITHLPLDICEHRIVRGNAHLGGRDEYLELRQLLA